MNTFDESLDYYHDKLTNNTHKYLCIHGPVYTKSELYNVYSIYYKNIWDFKYISSLHHYTIIDFLRVIMNHHGNSRITLCHNFDNHFHIRAMHNNDDSFANKYLIRFRVKSGKDIILNKNHIMGNTYRVGTKKVDILDLHIWIDDLQRLRILPRAHKAYADCNIITN